MRTFRLLPFLIFCLVFSSAFSQTPGLYYETLDGNKVSARMHNAPDMFWNLTNAPAYEVPKNSGLHSSFSSSMWIGGMDQSGGLHFAGQTYRQSGVDFFPGPYRSTGNYDSGNTYDPSFSVQQVVGLSNGKVLFVGTNELVSWDPSNGSTQTYNYNSTRLSPRATELPNGNILLSGDGNFPTINPLVELTPNTLAGTQTTSLSVWHGFSTITVLNNGLVLFAGSQGCDLYSPGTQTANPAAAMGIGRLKAASIMLPNGNVLVTGGTTTLNGINGLTSTEIYDVAGNSWSAGPAMSMGRREHSMIEMVNGEILIVGGSTTNGLVDHFDPTNNTLSTPANLAQLFLKSTLTNQANGNVAIATKDQGIQSVNLFSYTPGQSIVSSSKINGVESLGAVLSNGNIITSFSDGPFRELDAETLRLVGQRWQDVWKINKSEIDQFLQDYANGNVNFANYPVIEKWPAHGSVANGEDYYQAPFIDVDMDGVYDPAGDGDYPCIEGDQALWWTFNDDAGQHTETGGDKFGLQVKTMAYSYDCATQCPTPWLDHTTFYHYTLQNKSANSYSDVYFSIWTDADLGNYSDDYVGCDTNRALGFCYNGDIQDDQGGGGYGVNPPAIGTMFLEGPLSNKLSNFMYYENDFSPQGNPSTPIEFHNLQRSIWIDGTPLTVGGNGYGGTVQTNYMFPGDGGYCGGPVTGWSEVSENNQPFDRRYIMSIGPFNLAPEQIVELDVAVIWARDFSNENLGSVCALKEAADSLKVWFGQQSNDCFNIITSDGEVNEWPWQTGFVLYPNPTNSDVMLEVQDPLRAVTTVGVYDQLGRQVRNAKMEIGQQKLQLTTAELPNGVYIVRMSDGTDVQSRKLVVRH